MKPVTIIEAFHPIDDIDPRVISRGISLSIHALNFERLEEALDDCIISAIRLAAHRCRHAVVLDQFAIFLTGILAPTIGVHN
ncbi:MAG: hypothetical protein ACI9BW_004509 [Gammaproteobacteria bacterium]|jgi:hypothetical protein